MFSETFTNNIRKGVVCPNKDKDTDYNAWGELSFLHWDERKKYKAANNVKNYSDVFLLFKHGYFANPE
ncbi:hypothetical protein GCM10008083_20200 [Ulvibacter litoralis]|nr:hypothetical protein GCM10008083_20200 [Ulvibacter litoralis]